MMKPLNVSWAIQSTLSTLAGIAVLIGWLIADGDWTWVDYVVFGFAVWIGVGAVWMLFMRVRQKRW